MKARTLSLARKLKQMATRSLEAIEADQKANDKKIIRANEKVRELYNLQAKLDNEYQEVMNQKDPHK